MCITCFSLCSKLVQTESVTVKQCDVHTALQATGFSRCFMMCEFMSEYRSWRVHVEMWKGATKRTREDHDKLEKERLEGRRRTLNIYYFLEQGLRNFGTFSEMLIEFDVTMATKFWLALNTQADSTRAKLFVNLIYMNIFSLHFCIYKYHFNSPHLTRMTWSRPNVV